MISINGIRLSPTDSESSLSSRAAKKLGIKEQDILSLTILKRSVDARRKSDVHYTYTLGIELANEGFFTSRGYERIEREPYAFPKCTSSVRPVIAGFGPAGMFAALVLAEAGLRPIVLERGDDADTRKSKVDSFWSGAPLDTESNVQFGEGGAGTFSDGKLNTGIRDKRIRFVLETFVRFGANERILGDAKPHIGTDVLINVVKNLRAHVISLGAEVRFRHKLTNISVKDGAVREFTVSCPTGNYTLSAPLILALGHSARDTFEYLLSAGIPLEPKPFAMGVRIEHSRETINASQYGSFSSVMPAADYKLTYNGNGRSVYSFCMCPGGNVVAAASEEGCTVTNGMSLAARDAENSNAAIIVAVRPDMFPDSSPLGGIYWQRDIERRAYALTGSYRAPAQTAGDFLGKGSYSPSVRPSYLPGVESADIRSILPRHIADGLSEALPAFARKISAFGDMGALLTAPETRTSSCVRILRNPKTLSSPISGIYPAGEGAGYAGGIMSAAVDGIKCAEALASQLR